MIANRDYVLPYKGINIDIGYLALEVFQNTDTEIKELFRVEGKSVPEFSWKPLYDQWKHKHTFMWSEWKRLQKKLPNSEQLPHINDVDFNTISSFEDDIVVIKKDHQSGDFYKVDHMNYFVEVSDSNRINLLSAASSKGSLKTILLCLTLISCEMKKEPLNVVTDVKVKGIASKDTRMIFPFIDRYTHEKFFICIVK